MSVAGLSVLARGFECHGIGGGADRGSLGEAGESGVWVLRGV